MELSKTLKKALRTLAGVGYERSLAVELEKLDAHFTAWKAGEIDPFELSEEIHAFHNGPARELYNRFDMRGDPLTTVAALVVDGILTESEISPELGHILAPTIKLIKEYRSEA